MNNLLAHNKQNQQTAKKEIDIIFHKQLIWLNALLPLILLIIDIFNKQAGANPIEFALRFSGVMALIFLLLSLAITPLRRITGATYLIKYRRLLGLFAFFYATFHACIYIIFDKNINLIEVFRDILKRPFISIGMLAFLLLIPLAITSFEKIRRKIKAKTWLNLHKLSYLIAILAIIHYYLLVKSDISYPLLFSIVLFILLSFRISFYFKTRTIKK